MSLDSEITKIQAALATLATDQPAAFSRFKHILAEANQPQAVLLVAGVASAPVGAIGLPVTLIPSGFDPVAVQADFVLPAGMTFLSATLGPIPLGAGKSLQTAKIGSTIRVLVFGLNQTIISDGLDFTLNLVTTIKGQYPILLQNAVASDASGTNLPLCVTSGIVGVL